VRKLLRRYHGETFWWELECEASPLAWHDT
jgi:hypothetical protein